MWPRNRPSAPRPGKLLQRGDGHDDSSRLWARSERARRPASQKLPRLLDLGADKCIPCKAMAPILEDLKKEYAGRMDVEFIDVWKNQGAGKEHGVEMIPTQIFFDAEGKELFRHTGFFGKEDILGKWKELGVDLGGKARTGIVREQAVSSDARPRDQVCFMCDGDVNAKTRTVVKGQAEQRVLCSPHCYFIYFSSVVGADARTEDAKVSVTDWASGDLVAATSATFLYGMDAQGFAQPSRPSRIEARPRRNSNPARAACSVGRAALQGTRDALCVLRPRSVSRGRLLGEVSGRRTDMAVARIARWAWRLALSRISRWKRRTA